MAIPLGTTSRQLAALTRWLLTGLLAVSVAAWWWPGFLNWGAMIGGLLAVWVLWMFRQVIEGEHTGWGNPLQAVLAVLSVFVLVHLLPIRKAHFPEMSGGINASALTVLGMLSLAMVLCQGVLCGTRKPRLVLSILGLAMMAGPVVGVAMEFSVPYRTTLVWLSLSGACVWLCAGLHQAGSAPAGGWPRAVVYAVAASAAVCGMMMRAPLAVMVGLAFAGGTLLLVLTVRCKSAIRYFSALGVAAGCVGLWCITPAMRTLAARGGVFGMGENALAAIKPGLSGLAWLGGLYGWASLAVLVGGFALCLIWLLGRSRAAAPLSAPLVLWPMAGAMALLALLGPHGPFLPATLAALGLTWGALPSMLDSPVRRSGGWAMVIVAMALLLLMGLVSDVGLAMLATTAMSGDDKTLHVLTGLLMGTMLVWLVGRRRVLRGLAAIAVAIAFGGAGELAQQYFSPRGGHWDDFFAHTAGSAVACVAYLLCIFSRWSESSDVRASSADAYER